MEPKISLARKHVCGCSTEPVLSFTGRPFYI